MKKYISPEFKVLDLKVSNILGSSGNVRISRKCSENCKYWHMCQDRLKGKHCDDFVWK